MLAFSFFLLRYILQEVTNVLFMLLFRVVSVKWSHDLIYIKHLWIIKEVTFTAQFTTSGTRIEDGKLVILVGSFLCKYNLIIISLLFVIIWSIT